MTRRAALLALSVVAACAAPPRAGEELRGEVLFVHAVADMARRAAESPEPERAAMESSGFAQAVREGRAVRLRCALGDDRPLVTDAIAPEGLRVGPGSLVRFTMGSADPVVPNRILGALEDPAVTRGRIFREVLGMRQIVPWSTTPVLSPVTPEQERVYARQGASLLLRCRATA